MIEVLEVRIAKLDGSKIYIHMSISWDKRPYGIAVYYREKSKRWKMCHLAYPSSEKTFGQNKLLEWVNSKVHDKIYVLDSMEELDQLTMLEELSR